MLGMFDLWQCEILHYRADLNMRMPVGDIPQPLVCSRRIHVLPKMAIFMVSRMFATGLYL